MSSQPEQHEPSQSRPRTGQVARQLRYRSSPGPGRPRRRTRRMVTGGLRQVAVVALLPLWPFVAYPLSLAAGGRRPVGRSRMLRSVVRHPVVNALAAPMRFVADRVRGRRSRPEGSDDGGWGPPTAGDREPRRPRPGPPVDAIALPEPRG